ncbi:protoporphyrinogen oxidase [Glutamicibacter sp. FBE19]|uniref:protoporphyrinogen oxidase n=1 Tax=Glutamicibacter sp. FBE19 TaxID=2761534 RepID=UPI00189668EC|nr:protoporphyrinogen oxidase [Glutamicibacter sp. FBE19]
MSKESTPAAAARRDKAAEAPAHALRLLEKVRKASEARHAKQVHHGEKPAQAPHAVIVGGGIAGLVAARDLRQSGHEVTVLEAGNSFGGCLRTTEVAGLTVDAGAESFALRQGTVASYLDELDLSPRIAKTSGKPAWMIQDGQDGILAHPMPATALMGIPADVRSDEVRNIVGRAATVRAAADLITPMNKKWATEKLSVAEVVRTRMGQAVLDQLVAPVVNGVYSTDPAKISIDAAAPGLRQAMQETGSLAKAVAALQASAPAGSRVGGLDGGMYTMVQALVQQLEEDGAALVRNSPVTAISYDAQAQVPYALSSLGQEIRADRVVIATPAAGALELLNPLLADKARISSDNAPNAIALAILVVDKPELDDAPRGSGVLVSKQAPLAAKALTHSTAKWPWLADEAGPGTHVLRLSFGRIGEQDPVVDSGDDQQLIELAIKDASKILGVQLHRDDVLGSAVSRFSDMVPLQGEAAMERRKQLEQALAPFDGLDVVGAWISGTGLARVIGQARRAVAISAR